jgi:translation elongation factor Ts
MVKELRDRTGAGMMECKKALVESEGNMDKAIEAMRKAGQAKADKKSSRIAAEGVVTLAMKDGYANMIEINCETDFVAKDENFLEFVKVISDASIVSYKENLEDFINSKNASGKTIEETRLELVSKVGENVKIRRIKSIDGKDSYLGHYMHGSKIGVVVTLEKENDELAKDICMHVAAMKPSALNANDISKNDLNFYGRCMADLLNGILPTLNLSSISNKKLQDLVAFTKIGIELNKINKSHLQQKIDGIENILKTTYPKIIEQKPSPKTDGKINSLSSGYKKK